MTFYTKPPPDVVSKTAVEPAIQARYNHHKQQRLGGDVEDLHTTVLDVDNVLDHASHLCLKLIAVTCEQFYNFFIESEVELFRRRLDRVTEEDVRKVLEAAVAEAEQGKAMYRSEECVKQLGLIVSTASSMLEHCEHAFHREHPKDCTQHHLKMHFTNCTRLVAARAVELSRGTAFVTCDLWRRVLVERFELFLRCSTQEVRDKRVVDVARADPRVWPFLSYIKRQLRLDTPRQGGSLTRANLEERSRLFPPCMRGVYGRLKERHRLTHEARRALTLFLKDAGMALHEALSLWSREYSKHAHEGATCSHSWQKDYKKLTYSIRHMYGLEGSRIHYASFPCSVVQAREADMRYEVVCPFKETNLSDLEKTLPAEDLLAHPSLVQELRGGQQEEPPLSAKARCHLYLQACHGCLNGRTFESPIGYYRCALDEAW